MSVGLPYTTSTEKRVLDRLQPPRCDARSRRDLERLDVSMHAVDPIMASPTGRGADVKVDAEKVDVVSSSAAFRRRSPARASGHRRGSLFASRQQHLLGGCHGLGHERPNRKPRRRREIPVDFTRRPAWRSSRSPMSACSRRRTTRTRSSFYASLLAAVSVASSTKAVGTIPSASFLKEALKVRWVASAVITGHVTIGASAAATIYTLILVTDAENATYDPAEALPWSAPPPRSPWRTASAPSKSSPSASSTTMHSPRRSSKSRRHSSDPQPHVRAAPSEQAPGAKSEKNATSPSRESVFENESEKGLATASEFVTRPSRVQARGIPLPPRRTQLVGTEGGRAEHRTFRIVCGPIESPMRRVRSRLRSKHYCYFGARLKKTLATDSTTRAACAPSHPRLHNLSIRFLS